MEVAWQYIVNVPCSFAGCLSFINFILDLEVYSENIPVFFNKEN